MRTDNDSRYAEVSRYQLKEGRLERPFCFSCHETIRRRTGSQLAEELFNGH